MSDEYICTVRPMNEIDDLGNWHSVTLVNPVVGERGEPIVRCRDCKHLWLNDSWDFENAEMYYTPMCTHPRLSEPASLFVEHDGFCAWGEKVSV